MKKKLINFWLLAALMCGLGLSVTSCKDDDDDNKSEEQQQQEQEERASKFWSVVGQLVSSDDYAADYEDKTFEPVYGIADATNETTRIVETNDMQTAARRFSDLVGASIDENTPSYTYSDPEVGTLTYTRGGTADDWATVDVSIKQVPRLRKIIYREGGEGTNASFAGKAWYRFGDVVTRTLDNGKVEYWICVRPAFGPEKKGDSHWVCLNYLPPKNFFNYSYDSKSWTVPTGIGTDKENMQNLAEMLYAITRPEQWYNNANTYHTDGKVWGFSGLPIFADFKKANVMYHNQYFWQNVADGWTKHGVADKAMNVQLGDLADRIEQEGIHLLYEGYQWWTKTSWNCKLWQASYTNGTKNDEKNLHHAEYKDITKRMQDIKFDCTKMGSSTDNYIQFFDNDGKYRWVVRHATGKELNGGSQPAPTSQLQGPGVKDFYRYYEDYKAEWYTRDVNGGTGPEITASSNNVNNAPDDLTGVFQIGDVLQCVEDGTKWFCMLGKPENTTIPFKDKEATFVSFDIPESGSVKAQGLPSEAELPEYAFRFLEFLFQISDCKTARYHLDLYSNGNLGSPLEHIKRYAGIDIHDLYVYADSVWIFKDNKKKDVASESGNVITNMAYDDGSADHQAVARLITDYTQCGSGRTYCNGTTADGKSYKFEDWHFYIFKHYEYFDASRQTPFPTGWNELGATAWQWLWPVSNTQITLQDLTNQALVTRYAAADKWACLPIQTGMTTHTERRTPRTQAETSVKPADFFYKDGRFATAKRSLWNEPVLFMRMAKIVDPGHRQLNLESTDGRHFRVIHMQTEKGLYSQNISSTWAIPASADRVKGFYIDNVPTPLPEFEF